MKTALILSLSLTLACMTTALSQAAESKAGDEVLAAAKALANKPNYSWKTTVVVPETAQFKPGPTEGQTEKDGFTHVKMTFGDNTTEAVTKGDKGVGKDAEGNWKTAADLENAEGRGRFLGRLLKNLKAPAAQVGDLVAATGDLKKDGDAYSGDLTEDGAKKQFRFGQPQNPKGSVKFWVKDGVLSKVEVKVSAKIEFNGNEVDASRTTTTEIQKIGSTTLAVPTEAKKMLE